MWMSRIFIYLCVTFLLCYSCSCRRDSSKKVNNAQIETSNTPSSKPVTDPELALLAAETQMQPHWLEQTWLDNIAKNFEILQQLFDQQKSAQHRDVVALLQNNYQEIQTDNLQDISKLSPAHRVLRARLHLRLAHFYDAAYSLALQLHLETMKQRLDRRQKLNLGQLFYYYYARILCLMGQYQTAQEQLAIARQQVNARYHQRIDAWAMACTPEPAKRSNSAQKLAQLSQIEDPDTLAEWILLHFYFDLSPQIYANIWQNRPWQYNAKVLKGLIHTEHIKEGDIETSLEYYDPSILWIAMRYHAQSALQYLQTLPSSDLFAPFLLAQCYQLIAQRSRAIAEWQRFIHQPPIAFDWAYVVFSSHQTLADFIAYAKVQLALAQSDKKAPDSISSLLEVAKDGYPARALAGWGLLQLDLTAQADIAKRAWFWLRAGSHLAQQLDTILLKRYSTQKQSLKGANAIFELRLQQYATRSLYLWSSQAALINRAPDKALRWLEILHEKEIPYQIGRDNQPLQILWTTRAYMQAGRWEVSTLFMAKNKENFPAIEQLWSLFRLMRIYRGMGYTAGPKSG
jgi:hypothetical protein